MRVSAGTASPDSTEQNGTWSGRSGVLHLRWTGAPSSTVPVKAHHGLTADLLVPAGRHHDLVLEISDQTAPGSAAGPDGQLARDRDCLGRSRSPVG